MISKVSWLLSLAIIYSCFCRLGEAHVTMKSCLGVWILFAANHTFEKCLSESIINQWLSTICGTSANKVSYIARYRGLSKYLRSINITAFEPEYPRCSYTYAPYVFSDEEWKE